MENYAVLGEIVILVNEMDEQTKKLMYANELALRDMAKRLKDTEMLFAHYKKRIHSLDKQYLSLHDRISNLE